MAAVRCIAAAALIAIWSGTPSVMALEPRSMTLVVRDFSGVNPAWLAEARRIVDRIYLRAGITVVWLDQRSFEEEAARLGPAGSCTLLRTPILVNLGVAAGTRDFPRRALGLAASGSRLVRIAIDRVDNVARETDTRPGTLLGHAIAHEIGHVLLPPDSHTAVGLMREGIDTNAASKGWLVFHQNEVHSIQAGLAQINKRGPC